MSRPEGRYAPGRPWAVIATAVIAAALLLRLFRLSFQSYWFDEVMSIRHVAGGDYFRLLASGFFGDPPLYEFLLYFWVKIFGQGEAAVRLLSAIFSCAAVPALFVLARKLFDRKTAFLSAFLLSVSSYHIYYAQEARMYALAGFLVIVSNIFFINAVTRGRKADWLSYAAATVLAFYAMYYALFVALAANLVVVIFRRRYAIKVSFWLGSLAIIALMTLPWFLTSVIPHFITPVFIRKQAYLWVPAPPPAALFQTFAYLIWGQEWVVRNLNPRWWVFYKFALASLMILAAVNVWPGLRRREFFRRGAPVMFITLWCFVPVAVLYLVSALVRPFYLVRYVDVALPAVYILIAHAIAGARSVYLQTLFIVVFLLPNCIALRYYYSMPAKTPVRDIARQLKSTLSAGEVVFVSDPYEGYVICHYYPEISPYISGAGRDEVREAIFTERNFFLVAAGDHGKIIDEWRSLGWIDEEFDGMYRQVVMRRLGNRETVGFYYTKKEGL